MEIKGTREKSIKLAATTPSIHKKKVKKYPTE
jgi:hypothetical protein